MPDLTEEFEALCQKRDELRERRDELQEELADIKPDSGLVEKAERVNELLQGEEDFGHPDIPVVPTDPETGSPARGARREQVDAAIKVAERESGDESWSPGDVIDLIKEADPYFKDSRSQAVYSRLTELVEEDTLEKVGRGQYTLVDDEWFDAEDEE